MRLRIPRPLSFWVGARSVTFKVKSLIPLRLMWGHAKPSYYTPAKD